MNSLRTGTSFLLISTVSFAWTFSHVARADHGASDAMSPSQEGERVGADLRYTTRFEATVDGAPSEDRSAETAFLQAMIRGHATLIDKAQSKTVEAHLVQELGDGVVSEGVTAIQADVLVQMRAHAVNETGRLLKGRGHRYRATLEASLLALGTGQTLDTITTSGLAIEVAKERALQAAFERAGQALAEKILQGRPVEGDVEVEVDRIELVVNGLPTPQALGTALRKVPGILKTKVVYGTRALTKFSLVVRRKSFKARTLRDTLEATKNLGLRIDGQSEHSILATFVPSRAVQFPLLLASFFGPPSWRMMAPRLLGEYLEEDTTLSLHEGEPVDLGTTPNERVRRLRTMGLVASHELVLSGEVFERSEGIDIIARIQSAQSGEPGLETIVQAYGGCPKKDPLPCMQTIAETLRKKLPEALRNQGIEGLPAKAPALELGEVAVDRDLFFARGPAYAQRGLGHLVIRNTSDVVATHGEISVRVEGFPPLARPVPDLHPRTTLELPIPFAYASQPPTSESPRTLRLEVSYQTLGQTERVVHTGTMNAMPAYALDWSEPNSIAAFVTTHSKNVQALATAAKKAIPSGFESEPHAIAAALFQALAGIDYIHDAVHPGRSETIDDIQFPDETLDRKAGDCDDLAVLYAALAESIGARVLFVLTPGHILVALDSGATRSHAPRVSLEDEALVHHAGQVFIPIESTLTRGTFQEAWREGAKTIQAARASGKAVQLVDLRAAWAHFPSLEGETLAHPMPSRRNKAPYRLPSFKAMRTTLLEVRDDHERAIEAALTVDSEPKAHATHKDDAANPSAKTHETSAAAVLSRRAALLFALGRTEEAKALLEEGAKKFPRAELENNLGNVHLVLGETHHALPRYAHALSLATNADDKVRVSFNLAIAAYLDPDPAKGHSVSTRHIMEALQSATTESAKAIVSEFVGALVNVGDAPSLEKAPWASGGASDGMASLIARSLEARTKSLGTGPSEDVSKRASEALATLVLWMGISKGVSGS